MLEKIWYGLTNNQKKEIGKYALVFCGGALAGFVIKKTVDSYLEDMSSEISKLEGTDKKEIDIDDLKDEIILDEDILDDI